MSGALCRPVSGADDATPPPSTVRRGDGRGGKRGGVLGRRRLDGHAVQALLALGGLVLRLLDRGNGLRGVGVRRRSLGGRLRGLDRVCVALVLSVTGGLSGCGELALLALLLAGHDSLADDAVSSFTARIASSLPGIGKSTTSGSQFVSSTATTGMRSFWASETAMCSLLVSTIHSAEGTLDMSAMPPRTRSSLMRSR